MTTRRYTLPTSPHEREVAAARLWAAGAHGVWEQADAVVGWFATTSDAVPDGGTWQDEPDVDWQAAWKQTVGPVLAGPVAIVPTWLADDFTAPEEVDTVVVLDPGQAFGSGHHATTTLCTEYLAELDLDGRTVFDVGTGTGVLAIVAALRGATDVLAVDIDAEAVTVTEQNIARAGVAVEARRGSVDTTERTFDVVVANLVTDVITELAPQLAARVRPGGRLVASGIDADRAAAPRERLRHAGLALDESRVRDGWAGDLWSRPAG